MANPLPWRMPTSFYRLHGRSRARPAQKNATLPGTWALRPVLDQVAARHRHMLDQCYRATLIKVPSRILLVEGVLRRHAVDRHDRLEAALGRALGGAGDRALRRGASNDHGADAL